MTELRLVSAFSVGGPPFVSVGARVGGPPFVSMGGQVSTGIGRIKKTLVVPNISVDGDQFSKVPQVFTEAQPFAWKVQKNKDARLILQPYATTSIKWFLTYCMTWLPYGVFKIIYRLKGGNLV